MEPCPICNEPMEYTQIGNRDAYRVSCDICGKYNLTRTVLTNLRSSKFSFLQRANIYGWLRMNPNFEISTSNIKRLAILPTPSFHDKADRLLMYFDAQTSYAGKKINKTRSWLGFSASQNNDELEEILLYLVIENRISLHRITPNVLAKIEPQGWAHLETIKKINSESNQGFVAMWFSKDMQIIYDDVISIAILEAGYSPHRVDQREHNDKIDDEIIAQIRKSRFVLADFTGHRGGVYYEAGFAKGLNIEVIWTCREDDIDNLHFDIRQYNCILWSNDKLNDFKIKIRNRIEAVIGAGKLS